MKKYFAAVALATLVLAGCVTHPDENQTQQPQTQQPPVTTVPTPTETVTPPPPVEVPQPPKILTIDWNAVVQPMVAKMLQADGVQAGSVLLLDNVKNSTNGSLQTSKISAAMHDAFGSNKTFNVVPTDQLNSAKQMMGLSPDDNLVSRTKAIALARQVSAQYVLYSDVSGNVKTPTLDMQLMTVPSGEIVWSGSGAAVASSN